MGRRLLGDSLWTHHGGQEAIEEQGGASVITPPPSDKATSNKPSSLIQFLGQCRSGLDDFNSDDLHGGHEAIQGQSGAGFLTPLLVNKATPHKPSSLIQFLGECRSGLDDL